jgi:hypothetical protein
MIDRGRFLVISWFLAGAYLIGLFISVFEENVLVTVVFYLAALVAKVMVSQALPAIAATWFIRKEEFNANARWLILAMLVVTLLDIVHLAAARAMVSSEPGPGLGPMLPFFYGPLVFFVARAIGERSSSVSLSRDSGKRATPFIVSASVLLAATPALAALAGMFLLRAGGRETEWNPIFGSWITYVTVNTMFHPHLWVAAVLQALLVRWAEFATRLWTVARSVFVVCALTAAPAIMMHVGFWPWGFSMYLPTYGMLLVCAVGLYLVLMVRSGEIADSAS